MKYIIFIHTQEYLCTYVCIKYTNGFTNLDTHKLAYTPLSHRMLAWSSKLSNQCVIVSRSSWSVCVSVG